MSRPDSAHTLLHPASITMDRRDFLKRCAQLSLTMPALKMLSACISQSNSGIQSGPVLIIGAGAAGLTTGYLLQQMESRSRSSKQGRHWADG